VIRACASYVVTSAVMAALLFPFIYGLTRETLHLWALWNAATIYFYALAGGFGLLRERPRGSSN
jgi:hypothetical protein